MFRNPALPIASAPSGERSEFSNVSTDARLRAVELRYRRYSEKRDAYSLSECTRAYRIDGALDQ